MNRIGDFIREELREVKKRRFLENRGPGGALCEVSGDLGIDGFRDDSETKNDSEESCVGEGLLGRLLELILEC